MSGLWSPTPAPCASATSSGSATSKARSPMSACCRPSYGRSRPRRSPSRTRWSSRRPPPTTRATRRRCSRPRRFGRLQRALAAGARAAVAGGGTDTRDSPRADPRVMQLALEDVRVNYTLIFCLEDQQLRNVALSALHAHILDLFNEYRVQIVTPNYEADPPEQMVVPKADWFAAPARPESNRRLKRGVCPEAGFTIRQLNRTSSPTRGRTDVDLHPVPRGDQPDRDCRRFRRAGRPAPRPAAGRVDRDLSGDHRSPRCICVISKAAGGAPMWWRRLPRSI